MKNFLAIDNEVLIEEAGKQSVELFEILSSFSSILIIR